jgi:hypothetical protein
MLAWPLTWLVTQASIPARRRTNKTAFVLPLILTFAARAKELMGSIQAALRTQSQVRFVMRAIT